MNLRSMRMKKTEIEESSRPVEVAEDRPEYPWGLSINLEKGSLENLGISVSGFRAGDEVLIVAKAKVQNVSESEHTNHKGESVKEQSMSLQITDMEVNPDETEKITVRDLK